MFEKTLTDVVKGIRASKRDTSKYISQCIAEIKTEMNSSDMFVKANALQKLTFLQMMGFTMNWDRASFATIEVMSSPRFAHKRVGYLAAVRSCYVFVLVGTFHVVECTYYAPITHPLFRALTRFPFNILQSQGFTQDTEVILLTTNLLKKELRGAVGGGMQGVYDAGLAINCISNIVTEDLARDLLPELTSLTSHPQPYLRKKAILCLFKLFVKYPQGLRLTFARLQQCLEDQNSSVVSCAVNVITELSDKNPKNYLHLAPAFFLLLTQSSNNWMLIKVVKLLGSLVPEEPRLARKLLDPLSAIVRSTQAKSLLYESVRTITLCLPYCSRKSDGTMPPNVPGIVELCANTLLDFVTQADQNLKYLGLVGFGSLMQSHPQVLSDPKYRPLILTCLSDQDVTIRTRALDLLTGMASRKNLVELVSQLLKHVEFASGSYKNDLVAKIVEMCSGDKYARMQDFKWYLDVLFQLGHSRGIEKHGDLLRAQVTNVAIRVAPVRPYAVRRSMEILLEGDGDASDDPFGDNGRGKHLMSQLLPGIAWIVGEYSDQIRNALSIDPDEKGGVDFSFDESSKGTYHAIVQCLTTPANTQKLPTSTQKVYLQAALKVFAAASSDKVVRDKELEACVQTIHFSFPVYMQSTDVEVVERSFSLVELLKSLGLSAVTASVVPGLVNAAQEDSSDEESEGDLLGMDGGGVRSSAKDARNEITLTGSKSLAAKVRDASETLVYLLKPTPMKPPPPKAQRKKRQTPIGVTVDLDAPVDLSIFQDLIAEEEAYHADTRASVEAVSFTQQLPFKVEEPKPMRSYPTLGSTITGQLPPGISNDSPATSFQKPISTGVGAAIPRSRQGDPFYLESAPTGDAQDDGYNPNRFGTIQLFDSSDDESIGDPKRKKKKPKKARKAKSNVGDSSPSWPKVELAVFESEDEDDEAPGPSAGRKKGPSKEFAGLAKVDLTTPLREDEVMPERTHRVVPERPVSKGDRKKPKKPKKSKEKATHRNAATSVGDLLDLGGGFGEASRPDAPISFAPATSSSASHPINSAFDDLLNMSMPAPAPELGGSIQLPPASSLPYFDPVSFGEPSSPQSKGKRPWLKATLKSPSGSAGAVEWSEVSVIFRVYRFADGTRVGARLVVRVDNRSLTSLDGLSLDLKDYGSVSFDSISQMSSSKESDRVGPIFYSAPDAAQEIKGTLKTTSGSASVKIQLPACLLLNPESNVSLDQIAQELSSSDWSSSTAKVDAGSIEDPAEVKEALAAFLRAGLVSGSALSASTGTYAARSLTGAPVRFLVKVKEGSAKIDIKSTSSSLNKAIASDLKRLVLAST